MTKQGKIKVLLAKTGLDGHDRGIKTVARFLRDAGLEVIYTGLRARPEEVVMAAVQEDVDVLGLSFLSGDHLVMIPKITAGLRENGLNDVVVIAGGIILKQHIPRLEECGVSRVFLPGTDPEDIVAYIKNNVRTKS